MSIIIIIINYTHNYTHDGYTRLMTRLSLRLGDSPPELIHSYFIMSALDLLESHFKCMVCLEEFLFPKILPCHHTICLECIKKLPYEIAGNRDEQVSGPGSELCGTMFAMSVD